MNQKKFNNCIENQTKPQYGRNQFVRPTVDPQSAAWSCMVSAFHMLLQGPKVKFRNLYSKCLPTRNCSGFQFNTTGFPTAHTLT